MRDFEAFLASPPATSLIASGRIVRSAPVDDFRRECLLGRRKDVPLLLECERIPFPSYPAEWPPEMLHAAAAPDPGAGARLSAARHRPEGSYALQPAFPGSKRGLRRRPVVSSSATTPIKPGRPAVSSCERFCCLCWPTGGSIFRSSRSFPPGAMASIPKKCDDWTPCYARLLAPFRPIWHASRCKPAGPQATLRHLSKLLAIRCAYH